jgi:hypothetical protein
MRIAPQRLSVKRLAPHTPSRILRLRVARYDTSCRSAPRALRTPGRTSPGGFSCWHRGHFMPEPPVNRAGRRGKGDDSLCVPTASIRTTAQKIGQPVVCAHAAGSSVTREPWLSRRWIALTAGRSGTRDARGSVRRALAATPAVCRAASRVRSAKGIGGLLIVCCRSRPG